MSKITATTGYISISKYSVLCDTIFVNVTKLGHFQIVEEMKDFSYNGLRIGKIYKHM